MGIFGFIFIILPIILFIIILGIGVTLVRNVLRVFGWRRTSNTYGQGVGEGNGRQSGNRHSSTQEPPKNKKVIGDDEGEYVDFEEVK